MLSDTALDVPRNCLLRLGSRIITILRPAHNALSITLYISRMPRLSSLLLMATLPSQAIYDEVEDGIATYQL